jgi:natural product precursor
MKKISLNGIPQRLSEKELKNVMGGSGGAYRCCCGMGSNTYGCWNYTGSMSQALVAVSLNCDSGGGCFM